MTEPTKDSDTAQKPRKRPGRPVGWRKDLLPAASITREEAMAIYQKRRAELQFDLSAEKLRRLFDARFADGQERTDEGKFRFLMEGLFDVEMPDEHKDQIDPELLQIGETWPYEAALPAIISLKVRGAINEQEALALTAEFSTTLERAYRRDAKRGEATAALAEMDARADETRTSK